MNLLIVGAGGHGHCCHEIAERMKCFDKISFLDDDERYFLSDLVVGKIKDLEKLRDEYDCCFIAIGNNKVRKDLFIMAKRLGYHMPILIDPHASVSKYCFIGEGSVVFPSAVLETHCHVDKGSIISSNTTICHDATVKEFSLIYSNTAIRPEAYIGEMTRIGSQCVISFGTIVKGNSDIAEGSILNVSKEDMV